MSIGGAISPRCRNLFQKQKIHEAPAAEEDVWLLDLYGRYGTKSKLLIKVITDRNSSQIKNQGHIRVKKRKDIILGNTYKMMNFGSNVREQKNLSGTSIGDIGR
jgi:hypothetical protein